MTDRKEYFKQYYAKNKAKLSEQMRAVYDRDRELQRARCHKYKLENKDSQKEYWEQYRMKHKSLIKKRSSKSSKGKIEYIIYHRLKRKYGISIPVPIIREIRKAKINRGKNK